MYLCTFIYTFILQIDAQGCALRMCHRVVAAWFLEGCSPLPRRRVAAAEDVRGALTVTSALYMALVSC